MTTIDENKRSAEDLTGLIREYEYSTYGTSSVLMPRDYRDELFYFNPSLLCLGNNHYLMSYRRLLIHVPSARPVLHPWKLWDTGWKFLHRNPDCTNRNLNFGSQKYRSHLSADRFISLEKEEWDTYPESICDRVSTRELDSTGMAYLRYDERSNRFTVLWTRPNLFGRDMNQDARLYRDEESGRMYLSYTSYLTDGFLFHSKKRWTALLIREFLFFPNQYLYFFPEEHAVPKALRQEVEKNCVPFQQTIFYKIDKTFLHQIVPHPEDGGGRHEPFEVRKIRYPVVQEWFSQYPEELSIGLGTPPIRFTPMSSIMAIHVKMTFRHRYPFNKNAPRVHDAFEQFLTEVRWDSMLRLHGKYLYFCLLIEFDTRTLECLRVSDAFLVDSSEPFLLQFPMSLGYSSHSNDVLFLSYGEGDVACRLVWFHKTNLKALLHPAEVFSTLGFRFLPIDHCQGRKFAAIQHFGYFSEYNCGDDMFQMIFQYLQKTYYPDLPILFLQDWKSSYAREDDDHHTLSIFGGGDIMNDYFLKEIMATPAYDSQERWAISVGFPCPPKEEMVKKFSWITTRNKADVQFPVMQFFPDLGFLLPSILASSSSGPVVVGGQEDESGTSTITPKFNLGISLYRTVFVKNKEEGYTQYVVEWCQFLRKLLRHNKHYVIHLIPFCIHPSKIQENDLVLNQHIKAFFEDEPRVVDISSLASFSSGNHVLYTYRYISQMDFMICGRFHSHVFSMASRVPFLSVANTRKCAQFLKNIDQEGLSIPIHDQEEENKAAFYSKQFLRIEQVLADPQKIDEIRLRLRSLLDDVILPLIQHFIETFVDKVYDFFHPRDAPPSSLSTAS